MAYEYGFKFDDPNKRPGAPAQLGDTGDPAPASPKGPTSSGSFTGLDKYITANASNDFGGQVATRAEGDVTAADNARNDAESQFHQRSDAGTINPDENFVKSSIDNAEQTVADPAALDRFNKMRTAVYTGKNNLTDYNDLFSAADSAQAKAKATGAAVNSSNPLGRNPYLQDIYRRNDYNNGQQKLDSALLSQSKPANDRLNAVQEKATQSGNNFNTLQTQLQEYAANNATNTGKAKTQVQQALGLGVDGNYTDKINEDPNVAPGKMAADSGAIPLALDKLRETAMTKNSQAGTDMIAAQARLAGRVPTTEDLSAYGLTGNEATWNLKPGDAEYFKQRNPLDKSEAATADDRSRIMALEKLAGQNPSLLNYQSGSRITDPEYTFDKSLFTSRANSLGSDYQSGYNAIDSGPGMDRGVAQGIWGEGAGEQPGTLAEQIARFQQGIANTPRGGGGDDNDPNAIDPYGINIPSLDRSQAYLNALLDKQSSARSALKSQYGYGNTIGKVAGPYDQNVNQIPTPPPPPIPDETPSPWAIKNPEYRRNGSRSAF